MTKKIANSIIIVSIISLILAFVLSFSFVYGYFNKSQISKQGDELKVLSNLIEVSGEEKIKNIQFTDYQVTILEQDGKIVFDNFYPNRIGEMEKDENYILGQGYEFSGDGIERKLYSAIKLSNGSVLRIMSKELTPIILIFGVMQPILIFIVIIIALSIFLAKRLSKNIVAPLKTIDLKNPLRNNVYDELMPLLIHLNKQKEELKNSVEELYKKNIEVLHITENIDEAILILDNQGKVISINGRAQELFNIKINDYYIANFFDYDYHKVISKALKGDSNTGKLKKDERVYKISAQVSRFKNDERAVFVLFDDITAEENILNFRKEFSANVSHELKTPLASIMGMSEMISEGFVKEEDVKYFAGKINKESRRLLNLIQDIIKLSRLDENSLNEHFENLNLKNIVEEICISLEPKITDKNIQLSLNISEQNISGIRQLIHDALYNLIDNAINYNNVGGNITVVLEKKAEGIIFSVEDNGIGIAQHEQERIFERFYRVDKSHSKITGGTGLGLAIVKNVAVLHKAKINVSSELNRGTKIEMVFNSR